MENNLPSKYFLIELNKKNKKNMLISLKIIQTCQKMLMLMVEIEKLHGMLCKIIGWNKNNHTVIYYSIIQTNME